MFLIVKVLVDGQDRSKIGNYCKGVLLMIHFFLHNENLLHNFLCTKCNNGAINQVFHIVVATLAMQDEETQFLRNIQYAWNGQLLSIYVLLLNCERTFFFLVQLNLEYFRL